MIRRQQSTAHVPIIIVSARADEVDRVLGLEMGADDYVVKPFSMKELAARCRAALRRKGAEAGGVLGYQDENFEVEFDAYAVRYRGSEIRLTPKEFELLRCMMERPGRVLTRERLLERVWGHHDTDVDARSIDAHIRRLRVKLGPARNHVETVVGIGYRFVVQRAAERRGRIESARERAVPRRTPRLPRSRPGRLRLCALAAGGARPVGVRRAASPRCRPARLPATSPAIARWSGRGPRTPRAVVIEYSTRPSFAQPRAGRSRRAASADDGLHDPRRAHRPARRAADRLPRPLRAARPRAAGAGSGGRILPHSARGPGRRVVRLGRRRGRARAGASTPRAAGIASSTRCGARRRISSSIPATRSTPTTRSCPR